MIAKIGEAGDGQTHEIIEQKILIDISWKSFNHTLMLQNKREMAATMPDPQYDTTYEQIILFLARNEK